jgi:hypothetical protein
VLLALLLTRTFRALRSRPFRLYFAGQVASASGTFVQQTALGWLVLRLTGSATDLGLVLAVGGVPPLGHLAGQPRLAGTPRPGHSHQPVLTQMVGDLLHHPGSAHETGRRSRTMTADAQPRILRRPALIVI